MAPGAPLDYRSAGAPQSSRWRELKVAFDSLTGTLGMSRSGAETRLSVPETEACPTSGPPHDGGQELGTAPDVEMPVESGHILMDRRLA